MTQAARRGRWKTDEGRLMEDAVRIAVVDDVQGEQEKLCNLLLGYAARKGCRWEINRFSSGEAFLADTEREHRYNLVFLDILMNGIDGLETAKRLRKKDPQALIVFVTTEADYAVEGYEVEAAGFLVKGGEHSRERLERLMIRLERKLQHDAMFDLSAYHPAVKFPVGTLLYAECAQPLHGDSRAKRRLCAAHAAGGAQAGAAGGRPLF